ncbi:hypothetical protein [Clostridium sp.]|uniref:hypothetical protein n=1 Tax=Clostridium TaxID=1485 RepID=UPI002900B809|nr:hypothetical protein [Clostridium sp.]MDU2156545.1 hypothetical protein [Clostridium sp.]
MNIKKITTYFLKLYRRKERMMKIKYKDGYLVTDGYRIFYLKSNEMEINPELIKDNKELIKIWEDIINDCSKLKYEHSKKINGRLIDKYSNKEKELEMYVDESLLVYFDLYLVELYGNKSFAPVAVKDKEEFVAAVCPLRMTGTEF